MAPLLLDAINQTIANPAASYQWHALLAQHLDPQNGAVPQQVEELLLAHIPRTGVEGFLMTTFLVGITGNMGYLSEAGMIVDKITPFDMDRLAAFAVYAWGRAIADTRDQGGFVDAMHAANIPEISRIQGDFLAKRLALPPAPRTPTRVQKIALLTSHLSGNGHTPTAIALQQAQLLKDLDLDVHIFSALELRVEHMSNYLGNQGKLLTPRMDVLEMQKMLPDGVQLTFAEERFSLLFRSQLIFNKISEFDPDLVFFVGLNSPLLTLLFHAWPVLGLCVHALPPMAPVDVWLTATPSLAGQVSPVWGDAIPDAVGFYHPYRIQIKPIQTVHSRKELGINNANIVLVTVGSRLETEISEEWAAQMGVLMHRYPSAVWLLVGGIGVLPTALARLPAEKLRLLPHHSEVRAIYQCCDVYVNPPRLGGGFSVAEAMVEGLAVVSFSNSDGGSKLGDFAVSTMTEYVDRLDDLLASSLLRQEAGAKMRELFSTTLDLDRSNTSLLAACEATLARFQLRVGG